jgi:chorismate mutase / prephenate dehydratase
MKDRSKLEDLREQVSRIDEEVLRSISRRAQLVKEVWNIKQENQIEAYAADRERIIHQRLEKLNQGPLSSEAVRTIFQEIISACLSLEKPLKIAYFGPEATFTHQAALNHFGHAPEFIQIATIDGIFEEVEKNRCDYGVVPIENSTEGSVLRTLDMFMETPLQICAETTLEISLYLMSSVDRIESIREIYSHPQALAQCSRWLSNNLPDIPVHAAPSTAKAAQMAATESGVGAIASKLAASLYNLKILKAKIEDYTNNITRFWVIGHKSPEKTGGDKTSIMFSVKDEAGALYKSLYPFSQYEINMHKIESRPSRERPWEYVFFIDVEGHITDCNIGKSLAEMGKIVHFFKVLGSYPRSV